MQTILFCKKKFSNGKPQFVRETKVGFNFNYGFSALYKDCSLRTPYNFTGYGGEGNLFIYRLLIKIIGLYCPLFSYCLMMSMLQQNRTDQIINYIQVLRSGQHHPGPVHPVHPPRHPRLRVPRSKQKLCAAGKIFNKESYLKFLNYAKLVK